MFERFTDGAPRSAAKARACLPEPACPHPDDLIGVTAGGEGAELSGSHRVGEVGGDAGDTNRALLQRASFPACEQGGS